MSVHCKVTNLPFAGGEFSADIVDASPFSPNTPYQPGSPARSCKVKVTPVPPP